jgi:hypothetical protein
VRSEGEREGLWVVVGSEALRRRVACEPPPKSAHAQTQTHTQTPTHSPEERSSSTSKSFPTTLMRPLLLLLPLLLPLLRLLLPLEEEEEAVAVAVAVVESLSRPKRCLRWWESAWRITASTMRWRGREPVDCVCVCGWLVGFWVCGNERGVL